MAGGPEQLIGDMDDRPGEDERLARGVSAPIDAHQCPGECLCLRAVLRAGLSGGLSPGTDGGEIGEKTGNLPGEVDIGEDRLPPPCGGELGEFIDQHLGELFDLPLSHPSQIGGEGEIHRIPADHPGEVPLERGPEADHVGQEDLRMPGGPGHRHGMGEFQPEPFEVFERLAGAVGPVDIPQTVQVQIPGYMGVAHFPGEDVMEGVFPLDPLGKDEVRPFGGVGDIGVLLVLMEDELPDVVPGKPEAGVEPPGLFHPPLDQFGVDQFADERRREQADPRSDDLLLHLLADRLGGRFVDRRLADQGLDDALPVPAGDFLPGGPDEKGEIGGFRGRRHGQMFVLDFPSTLSRILSAAWAKRSS